jgi:hypothetical protein
MAIVLEDSLFEGFNTGASSFTTSGTITPAGSDRLLLVGVVYNNNDREISGQNISSVTFDTGTPTSLSTVTGSKTADDGVGSTAYDDGVTEAFIAKNPATSAQTVTVTISATTATNEGMFIGCWAFSGIDQTTPYDGVNPTKSEAGSTNPNVTVTSETGDYTVGMGFFEGLAGTVTHGAGPTSRYNTNLAGGDCGWFYDWSGAASRAYSWTAGVSDKWVCLGINLNAVAATTVNVPADSLTQTDQVPTITARNLEQRAFRFRNDDGSKGPRF